MNVLEYSNTAGSTQASESCGMADWADQGTANQIGMDNEGASISKRTKVGEILGWQPTEAVSWKRLLSCVRRRSQI